MTDVPIDAREDDLSERGRDWLLAIAFLGAVTGLYAVIGWAIWVGLLV